MDARDGVGHQGGFALAGAGIAVAPGEVEHDADREEAGCDHRDDGQQGGVG